MDSLKNICLSRMLERKEVVDELVLYEDFRNNDDFINDFFQLDREMRMFFFDFVFQRLIQHVNQHYGTFCLDVELFVNFMNTMKQHQRLRLFKISIYLRKTNYVIQWSNTFIVIFFCERNHKQLKKAIQYKKMYEKIRRKLIFQFCFQEDHVYENTLVMQSIEYHVHKFRKHFKLISNA